MTTQTLAIPMTICNFIIASEEPIFADSRDYGFDFDEEDVARELLAPLPAASVVQAPSEVEADEFEKVFQYFIS